MAASGAVCLGEGVMEFNLLSYVVLFKSQHGNLSSAFDLNYKFISSKQSLCSVPGPSAVLRPVSWSVAMPRVFQHVF